MNNRIYKVYDKFFRPYHLVSKRPWPLLGSISIIYLVRGIVFWFTYTYYNILIIGLLFLILVILQWWRDVSRERHHQGCHTNHVVLGVRLGIIIFIISEIIFFFSFFWSYFHSSLNVVFNVGAVWPSLGIEPLFRFSTPILNSFILICRGVTVTWAHHRFIEGNYNTSMSGLFITVFLGVWFTSLQIEEYIESFYRLADSVYGAVFFVSTGFHGMHVIIGTIFLLVCIFRLFYGHFSIDHHMGLEASIWYWHFVDVIWLLLFFIAYYWGTWDYWFRGFEFDYNV